MADENTLPVTEPVATAAAPAASPAPIAEAAPAASAEPAKIPVTLLSADAPAPEPAASPETKTDAPEPDKPAETVPVTEPKPAEGDKPVQDAPKEDASKSDTPAPLPAYEPWTLPEGITLDEKQSAEFSSLLGEFQNSSKAEQALVQKFGQTMVDKHIALVSGELTRVHEAYQNAWVKQTEDWKQDFVNDPEIGGKRQETTVKAANEFISTHGGTAEQQAEFRKLMGVTGVGNHPAMIRMFANAMTKFSESKQPAPMHFAPEKQSKSSKWYGKKTG